jgi:hypothetical protein
MKEAEISYDGLGLPILCHECRKPLNIKSAVHYPPWKYLHKECNRHKLTNALADLAKTISRKR